ncbi:MAG: ion transporter [Blautia sp.]|nr:ion transporter [Blautia sp.]
MKKGIFYSLQKNRKRIFDIIQIGKRGDFASLAFDVLIVTAILLNILTLFLETFDQLWVYFPVFHVIEAVIIVIFTLEYICRIWTADFLYPDRSYGKAVVSFLVSPDGIVDLLTILPFFMLTGFVALRMLRVVRILRLFRVNASYDSFQVIFSVLMEKANQILSSVFIIFMLMLAASLCIYSVEHDAQPDVYKNALSGIWWSLSTIFTVGYGDIYPITHLGRLIAVVITFLGVGVVAIPTGIISAGFVEQYTKVQKQSMVDESKRNSACSYLDHKSNYLNKSVDEVEREASITITAVIREGNVLMPVDSLVLREGDTLTYLFY